LPTDAKVCCRNIAARAISTQDKTSVSLNYLTATAGKKSKLRRARRGPDETLLRGTCGATWHTAPTRSPPPSRGQENADEYGYRSERDEGTSRGLTRGEPLCPLSSRRRPGGAALRYRTLRSPDALSTSSMTAAARRLRSIEIEPITIQLRGGGPR
jgi:hypothetical protein